MTILRWFLRLFPYVRELEREQRAYRRLQDALNLLYPPTTTALVDCLRTTAYAIVAPCIGVEAVAEKSPDVPIGCVRIVVQERGEA